MVFSLDCMHQTLHSGIQCLGAVLFHQSLMLWIFRCTWKQPHHLRTPVIEWMESRSCSDLKFESNSRVHPNLPAYAVFHSVPMRLIKNPKTPWTVSELAVAWWFRSRCYGIIQHKLDIPSVFRLLNSGDQILLGELRIFRVHQVNEFEIGSICQLVDYTLECLCNSGIVTTKIGSKADVSAGCSCSGVDWISNRWRDTEFCLCNGYHSRWSPIIPGKSYCARLIHSSSVFPHKMDSGNHITTFSVTNLQSIAAATEVKVFPRPISSGTSAPGISVSQTHLLTMNHMAQIWCARNLVPGRPGIEYLWPGSRSSVDWRIEWAFSSLTASSWHSCSNSLLIVLRTVFNTGLVLSGLRSSSPSTCSWTSLAPLSVFFSSSMISFSCSEVSWADGLILWWSWNSPRC